MICRTCRLNLLSLRTALPSHTSRAAVSLPISRRTYSTPSSKSSSQSTSASNAESTPKVTSSCPAGTPMLGLNYFKNKPDIVAGEDAEYPAWLWGLLDKGKKKGVPGSEVDTSTMNKKQRKRHEKKLAARMAAQPKVIPLHEQAIDITPAGAAVAEEGAAAADIAAAVAEEGIQKRREITKSARAARRKAIKEDNFLRGM